MNLGGATAAGGTKATAPATTDASPGFGGASTILSGGTQSVGGTDALGGSKSSGGGVAAGGTKAAGGGAANGGTKAAGGATASSSAANAGANSTGGTNVGGGSACPFPTTFKWKDYGGPLAVPEDASNHCLKDFSVAWVPEKSVYVVYATSYVSNWGGIAMSFSDFSKMGTAAQNTGWRGAVAPTVFYFAPKKQWVLTYQWGFQYATSNDPTDPKSWSSGKSLLSGDYSDKAIGGTGAIDQTVICDSAKCYLFFANDAGKIYRASMPIGSFPSAFSNATAIISETASTVFEAVQVYTVKGTGKYLMIVETNASPRYFRAYSADSLDGTFTVIPGASSASTPFAGKNNVTFTGSPWTADISHGDLVRDNPDETQTIDPCNMRLLYQGRSPTSGGDYGLLPYRPGLLTRTN
jgi:hypothetical protein